MLYYYRLILSAKTWDKYICELIDYYCPELYTSKIETNKSGYIYRQYNNVKFFNHKLNENNETEYLMQLECNEDQFSIDINPYKLDEYENICSQNSTWFSLKTDKKNQNNKLNLFKINEGDVIKIGKIIIRIRKIKFENLKQNNKKKLNIDINEDYKNENDKLSNSLTTERINDLKEIAINNKENHIDNMNRENIVQNLNLNKPEEEKKEEIILLNKNSDKISNKKYTNKSPENKNFSEKSKSKTPFSDYNQKCCRICYLDEDTDSNPLIQPCQCSGSLRYIHLDCLRHWIGTRNWTMVENNDHCCIYLIKEIDCELCKTKLPDYIRHKNKLYKIIEFKTEFKNYISFENLTLDKHKNKFIYVVNLDNKKEIKIGRGQEANIILSDISVSRVHCILNVNNKNVYLEDNDAKYGTLVLVQAQKLNLIDNMDLNLQIGRSFINCKIKTPFKLFSCCSNSKEIINYNLYFKQNAKKIEMKKILTVKTEVEEENPKEFILEKKNEIKSNKNINKKLEEPIMEIDLGIDEDENVDTSNIISKYTFISNDNCKNLLLNSVCLRRIDILSSLKNNTSRNKGIQRNSDLNNLLNSTGLIPNTHRTGNIFNLNK